MVCASSPGPAESDRSHATPQRMAVAHRAGVDRPPAQQRFQVHAHGARVRVAIAGMEREQACSNRCEPPTRRRVRVAWWGERSEAGASFQRSRRTAQSGATVEEFVEQEAELIEVGAVVSSAEVVPEVFRRSVGERMIRGKWLARSDACNT